MVGSQIDILTFDLSFRHNLCFKYSNGPCEPILNIYVSRSFQWYKGVINLMSFDPWNYSLKIWDSIGIPTPKVGIHLGMCELTPSHIPSHYWECKCDSQVALLVCTFPCFYLDHELKVRVKVRVVTCSNHLICLNISFLMTLHLLSLYSSNFYFFSNVFLLWVILFI
jgi:hypothetical protein